MRLRLRIAVLSGRRFTARDVSALILVIAISRRWPRIGGRGLIRRLRIHRWRRSLIVLLILWGCRGCVLRLRRR